MSDIDTDSQNLFFLMNDKSTDRLLSTQEVGQRLGTTKSIILKLINYKFLPAIKFGKRNKVSAFQLNNFISACEGLDVIACISEYERATTESKKQSIIDMFRLNHAKKRAGT